MASRRFVPRAWVLVLFGVMLVVIAVRWQSTVDAVRALTYRPPPSSGSIYPPYGAYPQITPTAEFETFFNVVSSDPDVKNQAKFDIDSGWEDFYTVLLLELAQVRGMSEVQDLLIRNTNQQHRQYKDWWTWIWNKAPAMPPRYADFKAVVYSVVDFRFHEYFDDNPPHTIRLEEVRWASIRRDGIPPLVKPEMIRAADAEYLDDGNLVFGVEINGEAVAYPKRILKRHEIVRDTVGGESINGVYCLLCDSMIVYRATVDGVHYDLGTSGFVYRSNKLLYDQETKSLWSAFNGEPVVGPLVGQDIHLERFPVVTTTWSEWRRRHPETKVLSLISALVTGNANDYSEGTAFSEYFNTDELLFFSVPKLDERLKNKDEVLAIRVADAADDQLAISVAFLAENPVLHEQVGSTEFAVLTDSSGASRVYETHGRKFEAWDGDDAVRDDQGANWQVTEAALVGDNGADQLKRLPAHRAFWFGWYSAYPETRLVKQTNVPEQAP